MHWTTDGADAIIALRCREASSQREAICNTPDTQTRTDWPARPQDDLGYLIDRLIRHL